MTSLRKSTLGLAAIIGLTSVIATPAALACDFHGGGYYNYNYDAEGMSYLEQLEFEKQAYREMKAQKEAELERARTVFASRFKVEPAPAVADGGANTTDKQVVQISARR